MPWSARRFIAFSQFFTAVKSGRKMEEKALRPLADGRVFSGQMALQEKLVDELGGLQEAIESAKKLAGLEGKRPQVIYKKEKRPLERLMRLLNKSPISGLSDIGQQQIRLLYLVQ